MTTWTVDPQITAFLEHPDTIDFITLQSEVLMGGLVGNPNVFFTQTLLGRYIVGYTNRQNISLIIQTMGASFINSFPYVVGLLDIRTLEESGIIQVQQNPYLDLKGRGVLVGFVDTGIDYTQNTFIYEDGTSKIQYIFDQTGSGNTPEGFYLGTEYNNQQINDALRAENPYDIVPQQDTVGHGTFLASLAAGRADGQGFLGAAPDAELIVVKLRPARPYFREYYLVPPEQENAYESSAVMVGIEYILTKARELNRPVVICIGVGTNLGGHDGFSLFEQYISEVAGLRGVCVCSAAGNENQEGHHMENTLTATGEQQNIDIRVGDNAGNIYVSIWSSASDRISVAVRSPTGELVGFLPARSGAVLDSRLVLEQAGVSIAYYFPVEGSGSQLSTVRIFNATPGIWTIIVRGDIVLNGNYHAWLPITGFVSPTVEFLTPSPYTTVVVPATSFGIITCGAYNSASDSLFIHSSWGPSRLPLLTMDLVAPGVNVGGIYPTGPGTMSGTSVANATAAGACALLLQWGIVDGNDVAMSSFQARAYLIRGCVRNENITYPNPQWGYGRLNLLQTFYLMRQV
ncbi:S8 family peptidase [Anoxybacterium hadale]|uniref:S8 family peptidase n=1 Tax=Anoxybacterium hadale TaxID=3408580 RepID=A0ACD1AFN2_9FIRM|nr:S8 family peptidase [Clostridiales bacterium]